MDIEIQESFGQSEPISPPRERTFPFTSHLHLFLPIQRQIAAMNPLIRPSMCQFLPRPRLTISQCLQPFRSKSTAPRRVKPRKYVDHKLETKLHGMIRRGNKRAVYPKSVLAPYPHGINNVYKASNLGLYGGARIGSGNNVSPITKTKTRRRWYPNVQNKKLWSAALNQFIKLKVTTRVLRTIDKLGGLDEYLLGEKSARIKELGLRGWVLRSQVMQTPWYKARRTKEAKKLGLSTREIKEWDKANHELRIRISDLRKMAEGLPVPERRQREVQEDVETQAEAKEDVVEEEADRTEAALPNQKQESEEKIQFMVEQSVSEPPRARL